MATLNQISDYICGQLRRPIDNMLKETVKFSIRFWRPTIIRRDVERNGVDRIVTQRVFIKLVKANTLTSCDVNVSTIPSDICEVLRSAIKVPRPIRLKGEDPFLFVGEVDGAESWTFSKIDEIPFTKYNKFTSKITRYDYINGYLFVFTKKHYGVCALANPLVDPNAALNFNTNCSECLSDDDEYPFGEDMIQALIAGIMSGEYKLQPVDKEININESEVNTNR